MVAFIQQQMEYISNNYNFMEELENEMFLISLNVYIQQQEEHLRNSFRFIDELEREMLMISMNSYIQQEQEFISNNYKYFEQQQREMIGFHLRTKTHVCGGEETNVCAICLDEFEEGSCVGVLDCRHQFHSNCVKDWLVINNVCPLCKFTGVRYG